MKVSLTKKQYKALLKLVMLGDWMTNTVPSDSNGEDEEIVQYLLSLAKDFGYENYVELDEELKKYFQTEDFENDTEILEIIGDYHEYALWEGLVLEFSQRDLIAKYGEKAVETMSDEERVEKELPLIKKYEEEFREYGLDNLAIKTTTKPKLVKGKK
jgi:hypothetical protein